MPTQTTWPGGASAKPLIDAYGRTLNSHAALAPQFHALEPATFDDNAANALVAAGYATAPE